MTYISVVAELGQFGPYKLGAVSSTGVKLLGQMRTVYWGEHFFTSPGVINFVRQIFLVTSK